MANKNDNLVVAYFENRGMAEHAAEALKDWDKANKEVKLGAVAVLTLDEHGKLDADEVGQRDTKKGALWGAAIGTAAGILTGGIALIPGLVVGAAAGGGLGALNHKSLGMSDEDRDKMVDQLRRGGAALAVMADDHEVYDTEQKLAELGGQATMYKVPEVTAEALRSAAAVEVDAATAVDEAVAAASDAAGAGAAGIAAVAAGAATVLGDLTPDDMVKLQEAGVDKASSLLQMGATPQGRAALAAKTGLDPAVILSGVKKLDLMRVKGVGPKTAGLLLASGVDTVAELGTRNPGNLVKKLADVNESSGLMVDLPSEKELTNWVSAAKELPRVVRY